MSHISHRSAVPHGQCAHHGASLERGAPRSPLRFA